MMDVVENVLHAQPPVIPHPLGGLPPEIWEKILEYLHNDPVSLYNCYKTCTSWKKILEPDKIQFLFQLVIPKLKNIYLPTLDLLKCRTICRKWRIGVDQTFQHFPFLRRDSSIHSGLPPYIWYNHKIGAELRNADELSLYLEDLDEAQEKRNGFDPLFHKSVKCISNSLVDSRESNRLFEEFRNLATSVHGAKIESCIYIANGGRPESERQIESIFKYLRNLKSLAILKNSTPMPAFLVGITPSGLEWLIRRRRLLPPLTELKSVNIYLDEAPLIAEMILLSYGTQLQSFHCDFKVISSCPFFRGPAPQHSLQNLVDLDIFDAFGSSPFLERLLMFEMPHLARLSLEYVEVGPRKESFKSILLLIDKFSASLREIRFPQKLFNWEGHGIHRKDHDELKKASELVTLPLVKRMGVNMELLNCPVKQWFFSKFQNLETLLITNYGVHYGRGNFLEKDLKGKLKQCWDLVPSLKKISVDRAYLEEVVFYK